MNIDEYISQRVDTQISWYELQSKRHKCAYSSLRIIELTTSVSIPLVVAFVFADITNRIITACLGVIIAVSSGILNLFRFHESWIEYRKTAELLKNEKFLFLTKSDCYNMENSFSIFVEKIESLISKENSHWAQYIKKEVKEVTRNG
jgi:hypothetical protein